MRKILTLLTATLLSFALAHAELEKASPAEGAKIPAPRQVVLSFTEGVQVRFSTFKVYRVGDSGDRLKVNGLAGQLVTKVLDLKNDAASRADLGLVARTGTHDEVTLRLRSKLQPGAYVVMWKALSDDSHPVTGYYVFDVH
ncbi:copper resistance CopC family protein [Deinococcus yavapaiensis]|uniref:CopC domain-containing protein n=1 Tax=Deinococcus yavapaiensis KR-236 TaxID=694435 RepID=A0A318S9V2_9DEIO|nr:copper resistance CopC family protein [Deinococcus yavapaiensis]PYE54830.1 hypothetical protein DES52_104101 [Deinococcus yavapaiensis KR-236]